MDQIQREIIQIFCIGNPILKEVITNERIIQELANKGSQIAQMISTGYHSDLKAEVSQKIPVSQNSIQHQLLMNDIAEKVHSQPDLLGNSIENEINLVKESLDKLGVLKQFGNSMLLEPGGKVGYVKHESGKKYEIGDIIIYRLQNGLNVYHVVVGYKKLNDGRIYRTQGINNKDLDPNPVYEHQLVGQVVKFSESELAFLIEMAEQGRIPYIEGLGMTRQAREKIKLLQDISKLFYDATDNNDFNLKQNFAIFNSFLTNDPNLQTTLEEFKTTEMSDKAISQDLIKTMNWIFKLKLDPHSGTVNGYNGFYTPENLESIKHECLKRFGEFSRENIISTDLLPLYDKYSQIILNSPKFSLKLQVGIFEIILGIETLQSKTDMKNKLGSYISEFARNP
ncbi:MAG: hypothetical protein P8Y70_20045, partial [Candidatus Lokiarchaeota archaeon]